MKALIALVAVLVLVLFASLAAQVGGLRFVLGGVLPYVAIVLFLGGMIHRVLRWAKAPVPFRIPTSCGQQKSLSWIQSSPLENPHNTLGVIGRMLLEVLFFRSLFRNTAVEVREGGKVVHAPNKWLWLFSMMFHWSFLIILVRHARFFTEPVPPIILGLQGIDGFLQIGVPAIYITSLMLLAGLGLLLLRRLASPQLRYISLVTDYFPLWLIIGIGATGVLLRHFSRTDLIGAKELTIGIIGGNPVAPDGLGALFYVHFFLVSVLLMVFPFSKLVHMAGVMMSPTRNLANTNRRQHHSNPWNPPVEIHTYAAYEDEFRQKMKAAGIPVEKE